MKKISKIEIIAPNFNSVRKVRHFYQIPQPAAEYSFYFKNKKEAVKFAAEYSRALTRAMYEINYFIGDVYKVYRALWPYMDNSDTLMEDFRAVDGRFVYLTRFHDVTSIYSNFFTIFNFLDRILNKLKAVATSKKHFNSKNHITVMQQFLQQISKNVFEYGKNSVFRIDYSTKKLF